MVPHDEMYKTVSDAKSVWRFEVLKLEWGENAYAGTTESSTKKMLKSFIVSNKQHYARVGDYSDIPVVDRSKEW